MSDKLIVVADSEADGYLDTAKNVWCICAVNYMTGERYEFTPENMGDFPAWAAKVDHWIGNFFLSYDAPLFRKILGVSIPVTKITDTVIVSSLQKFSREGGHSLEAWGIRLKHPKILFDDFSRFSPQLLERCRNDVELNYKVACYLVKERAKHGSMAAERLEHETQAILNQQQEHGFPIDVAGASSLKSRLDNRANEIEATLQAALPPAPYWAGSIEPRYCKDGSLSKGGLQFLSEDWEKVSGPFSRIDWKEFDTNSAKQKIERLRGWWSPTVRTRGYRSLKQRLREGAITKEKLAEREPYTWQLCEENFATISPDAPKPLRDLGELAMLRARSNEIKGWFDNMDAEGHVHGKCYGLGTITHRASHRDPNLGNTSSVDSPYGAECRACFIPGGDGYVLLGTDAKGIQLRVLAHYMNDPAYTDAVVNGDPHTKNLEAMGIDKGEWDHEHGVWSARARAKTFIYAWLLGAGDEKVGLIIGGTPAEGRQVKENFLRNTPALAGLKERAADAARTGRLVGLDGRRVEIKAEHYALSVYLQSGEAIIMKRAMVQYHHWARAAAIDFQQLAFVHDEFQSRVRADQAEELGRLQVKAIVEAGLHFKMNCPMDGAYRIGKNWLETH